MHAITPRGAVLIVLAVIGLLLAAGLVAAPANRAANRRLAALLAILAGIAAAYVLNLTHLPTPWRWLRDLPLALPLAIGPLLYGYVRALARGAGPRREWLHLAPAALQLLYLLALLTLPEPTRRLLHDGHERDPIPRLLEVAALISMAGYAAAGLGLLGRYRAWLAGARSDADLYAARWMRGLLIVLLVTLAAQGAIRLHTWFIGRLDVFDVYPFYLWLAAMGVWLGIEGRRYAERRFPAMQAQEAAPAADPEPEVPARPARDWAKIGAQWRDRTAEAGWWREPGLTAAELARRLGTNTSHLSRAINEGLGQNFAEMINGMRARAVAEALDAGAGAAADLLDLAFEAGFSSKASFNRAFRAAFGMSPSAWRARPRS